MSEKNITAKADIATASNADDKNNAPENSAPEKVSIKNATENTLFKNVLEFATLKDLHTAYLDDVGNKKLFELKGQTTIGNIFCLSSGYVGNKLGTSPDFAKVIKVFTDLFNAKHVDTPEEKIAKGWASLGYAYKDLPEKVRKVVSEEAFKGF